ncbi:putative ATP synthase subunit gamma, mitochondrial [Apostichopus japonicus]|uniref:ATP synthase subunit gamma n=1 Tax=Stichopus japonicus TaxID=307972 RepID=A0A2G8KHE8_STIJA|nr:putative ATP synthase subunit gamma, mitochondrial [Apostichopus japonicus]
MAMELQPSTMQQKFLPGETENHLIIAVSSDRGLCGGIHSHISKAVKASILEKEDKSNVKLIIIGDKPGPSFRGMWMISGGAIFSDKIMFSINDYGRKTPSFQDASNVASALLGSGYEFDTGEILFNRFRSVISYKTTSQPVFPVNVLAESDKMTIYDDVDSDILRNYSEFQLASILYSTMMESNCSEQSSRMTAMDNATKNAGEMIDKLTLQFNRTRQAVITRELIEIISGAAAL